MSDRLASNEGKRVTHIYICMEKQITSGDITVDKCQAEQLWHLQREPLID